MDNLLRIVKSHEGFSPWVYQDSLGYWTVGYGKCLDKRKNCGLTQEQAEYLLKSELNQCELELSHFTWFTQLDAVRQEVFIELSFNMGLTNLLKFVRTLKAVQKKDFNKAADELLDSLWAKQVKEKRANNIANRLRTGTYAF
jgi:lysozyme